MALARRFGIQVPRLRTAAERTLVETIPSVQPCGFFAATLSAILRLGPVNDNCCQNRSFRVADKGKASLQRFSRPEGHGHCTGHRVASNTFAQLDAAMLHMFLGASWNPLSAYLLEPSSSSQRCSRPHKGRAPLVSFGFLCFHRA